VQIRISTSSAGRPPRRYEEPVVGWFRSDECWLHSLLAIRSDRTRREVTADYLPFGLNYTLRRSVQLIPQPRSRRGARANGREARRRTWAIDLRRTAFIGRKNPQLPLMWQWAVTATSRTIATYLG
jgi:hypothetical protein